LRRSTLSFGEEIAMTPVSITLPDHRKPIEVAGDAFEAVLEELGTHDAFVAALAPIVEKEGFERFDRYDQYDGRGSEEWGQKVLEKFLREGSDAADDFVAGTIARSAEDYYDAMMTSQAGIKRMVAAIAKGLTKAFPEEDLQDLLDAAASMLRGRMAEALEAADTSKPMDGIAPSIRVIVGFMPGQEDGIPNVEDESIQGADKSIHPEYVVPERLLAAYLSFVNVPKAELLEGWAELAVDPVNPLRLAHDNDYDFDRRVERAAQWAAFDWPTDPQRPRLQTPAQILEVMENAGYCSVPTLAFRVPLKDFLTRDWEAPLHLAPGHYGRVGDLGLHNFIHGGGHTLANTEAVTLPAGRGGFISTETTAYGYASVYDLMKSYLDVAFTDGPRQEAAPEEPAHSPAPAM
jgi:hypothetical protein